MCVFLFASFTELLEVYLQEVPACWLSESAGLCRSGSGGLILSKVSPVYFSQYTFTVTHGLLYKSINHFHP